MKTFALLFIALNFLTSCTAQKVESEKAHTKAVENRRTETENKTKSFVLIELFTSEGCSSCPPADKVLARLQNEQPVENVEIVPLALHVDYWNYLGWRDEFSSNAFSQRQSGYAEKFNLDSIYTPQMIVDGRKQFTGSQFDTAINSIKEAAQTKKSEVKLLSESGGLKIDISDLPAHDDSYVWLAVTEDDLQTDVRRGENSGKKLSHTGVVRDMKLLGNLTAGEANFTKTENLSLQPNWKKEKTNIVVFVQGQNSKTVFAVGKIKLI